MGRSIIDSENIVEKTEKFNLSNLLETTIKNYEKNEILSDITQSIYIDGRKNLIKRCFNNLIDNSIKYSDNIFINLIKKTNNIII